MKRRNINRIDTYIRHILFYLSVVFLCVCVGMLLFGAFGKPMAGEADTGSFETTAFDRNWTICYPDGSEEQIDLPFKANVEKGEIVTLTNTFPEDVDNGMTLLVRSLMQDVYVSIDGVERNSYASENFDLMGYYLNRAYIVTDIDEADAGKTIEIRITVKDSSTLDEVFYGYGNNHWYQVIRKDIFRTVMALFLGILGLFAIGAYYMLKRHMYNGRAIVFVGLLMVDVGIWIFSESSLRQLLLHTPSVTLYTAIWSVELAGVVASLYFDEVQNHRYHRLFCGLEIIIMVQMLINTGLHFANILEFHQTLVCSHILTLIGLVCFLATILADVISGNVKKYGITVFGMSVFGVAGILELVCYYSPSNFTYGVFMCLGLLVLLFFTMIQTVVDEIGRVHHRETERAQATFKTMETIASSVYAKDEYTGGHSERVANYLVALAEEMRDEYELTDDDIRGLRYIGLMHDIGKIAVPDIILNKTGKLNEDEYTLMKRHTVVGDELLNTFELNNNSFRLGTLAEGIRHHHERYDGSGYPDGLRGEQIPVVARMISLADCYDAMTSNRVYRKRLDDEAVINEIRRCSGTQFDPKMAETFVRMIQEKKIVTGTRDGMDMDETGEIMLASRLEERLRMDMESVLNPSFVRMICYLIKMSEESHESVSVYFVHTPDSHVTVEDIEQRNDEITHECSALVGGLDICIRYTPDTVLVVLFRKKTEEEKERIRELSERMRVFTQKAEIRKFGNGSTPGK